MLFNQAQSVVNLADWSERRPVWELIDELRQRTADLSGVRIFPIAPPALGGRAARPVQFVIGGGSYEELAQWRDILLAAARKNPGLTGVDSDYKETKPQLRLEIDRDRAGDLGVSVLDISRTLETLLGSRRVTTFFQEGEEYDVVVEGLPQQHRSRTDMENIYVRSQHSGELIPLVSLVDAHELADAASLNRYNRLRAITIEAALAPDYTLGEALAFLEQVATDELPAHAVVDYKGESREFKESGQQVYFIFALSLVVVYLVLAAQFESFIHPFVIILTVPLAVGGALFGLWVCGETLNLYSQIGIIMLVGLATKNGILIVEFANQLRDEGVPFEEALVRASELRLRPVVMTSIATVMGAVPLMLAFGAGSEARYVIGVVIVFGVTIATLLTLLVVPAGYLLIARNTRSPLAVTQQLERELQQQPDRVAASVTAPAGQPAAAPGRADEEAQEAESRG
jgi:multidrug efflux pump